MDHGSTRPPSSALEHGLAPEHGLALGHGLALEHIGIAVPSLAEALTVWKALGVPVTGEETVAEQGVRVAFLDTGPTATELLEAIDEHSPIARFLASGRRGVHHIAYRVTDLARMLARLKHAGVPLIDEEPRSGSRGTRIAFLHPRGTHGVLIELVEHAPAAAPPPSAEESR